MLPARVDLREDKAHLPPTVGDQGSLNSGTAHALAYLYECAQKNNNNNSEPKRIFVYCEDSEGSARVEEGEKPQFIVAISNFISDHRYLYKLRGFTYEEKVLLDMMKYDGEPSFDALSFLMDCAPLIHVKKNNDESIQYDLYPPKRTDQGKYRMSTSLIKDYHHIKVESTFNLANIASTSPWYVYWNDNLTLYNIEKEKHCTADVKVVKFWN
jgi:hypothetical protein